MLQADIDTPGWIVAKSTTPINYDYLEITNFAILNVTI